MLQVITFISILLSLSWGNQNDNNIGWFWHVTDLHYDFSYWKEQYSCKADVPSPGIYGDYACDAPWQLIENAFSAMKTIREDADFILWTGDNVGHMSKDHLGKDKVLEVVANTTQQLNITFPDVPVYASLGNNDFYPKDQAPPHNSDIYNRTGELWKDWIDSSGVQLPLFQKGGYYSIKTKYGIRVVVLNTILYKSNNKLTSQLDDPADQLQWLDQILKRAQTLNEKVIITSHIPPGVYYPRDIVYLQQKFEDKVYDVINQHVDSDVIVAMFYGHTHTDTFKIFYKTNGSPGFASFTTPSLTPYKRHNNDVPLGPFHNPGIRLVSYDRTTKQMLNTLVYYIHLPSSNVDKAAEWKVQYNFTDEYKVNDIGAASLHELSRRMESDDDLVLKYDDYLYVSVDKSVNPACDEKCKSGIVCGLRHYNLTDYLQCKNKNTSTAAQLISTYAALILVCVQCIFYY